MPDLDADRSEALAAWLDHGVGLGGARSYLRKVQARLFWVPREAISLASEHYQVGYGALLEELTFNPAFSLEPRGKVVLELCQGLACTEVGAAQLLARLEGLSGLARGQTAADGSLTLATGPCQGRCAIGANARLNGAPLCNLGPDGAAALWERLAGGPG